MTDAADRSWIDDCLAIRRPILWWAAWATSAIALNFLGAGLVITNVVPTRPFVTLAFQADELRPTEADFPDPLVPVVSVPLQSEAAVPAPDKVIVSYQADGAEPVTVKFDKDCRHFALKIRLPLATSGTHRKETIVTLHSARGAALGNRRKIRIIAAPQPFVTFRSSVLDISPEKPFPGVDIDSGGDLTGPLKVTMQADGPSVERVVAKVEGRYRVPEAMVLSTDPGKSYSFRLSPPPGTRLGDHGNIVVRVDGSPALVQQFVAEPPLLPGEATEAVFRLSLSNLAIQEISFPVTLMGDGVRWVDSGMAPASIVIPRGKSEGVVRVPLLARKFVQGVPHQNLTAVASIPEKYRVPVDKEKPTREATCSLRLSGHLVVVARVTGPKRLDMSVPSNAADVNLSLSEPLPADYELLLKDRGTARLGEHYRLEIAGSGKLEGAKLTVPRGATNVGIRILPMVPDRIQPDREIDLLLQPPASPLCKTDGLDALKFTLTDGVDSDRLLVLLLGPNEPSLQAGWAKHRGAWQEDEDVGKKRWLRGQAFLVGIPDKAGGALAVPETLPGAEGKIQTPTTKPQVEQWIDAAFAARRRLLKDLPESKSKDVKTVLIWRSVDTPTDLRGTKLPEPLTAETSKDLRSLDKKVVFIWYGTAQLEDKVLRAVLVDPVLKEYRNPEGVVRRVNPNETLDRIAEAIKGQFEIP